VTSGSPARKATTETIAQAHDRHLRILGTRNLRDIGGYPAGQGLQTRWRTLFRADALDRLSPSAQRSLIDMGLRTVIDLRRPDELESNPNVFRASRDVRYRHLAMFDIDPGEHPNGPLGWYVGAVDQFCDRLVMVASALLEDEALPAVIHCAAGKDRTGITIGVLLSAIGVPDEVVADDYGLTKSAFATRWVEAEDQQSGIGQIVSRDEPVVDAPLELMAGTLRHVAERYGGAAAYLRAGGLTTGDVARLRELLTEPV
jgi:protein-tyrosine phosphatase